VFFSAGCPFGNIDIQKDDDDVKTSAKSGWKMNEQYGRAQVAADGGRVEFCHHKRVILEKGIIVYII
jgi:hypothetical protein